MTQARYTPQLLLRLYAPIVALALLPIFLAIKHGGYYVRDSGWVLLAVMIWACIQVARGRGSSPKSVSGFTALMFALLAAWSILSISWAQSSTQDAWVESIRTTGYLGVFVVSGSILANARSYARFAKITGVLIGLLGIVTVLRLALSESALTMFVSARLDWPIGYSPGTAALYLMGTFILLGSSSAAQLTWEHNSTYKNLFSSTAYLSLATVTASCALLAQSRGTIPATLVALIALIISIPQRSAVVVRCVIVALSLLVIHQPLGNVFQTQFAYRQAPFTKGANADALLLDALSTAHIAGKSVLATAALILLSAIILVPLSRKVRESIESIEARLGVSLILPTVVLVAVTAITLFTLTSTSKSPIHWVNSQWQTCVNPPDMTNDPGSATSYFSNTGTGRCDYYRVALSNFKENPLKGTGAGNFRPSYVLKRQTKEEPTTPHSLPLQALSDLGFIGAALMSLIAGCILIAILRFIRSGTKRDHTFAGAVAALAYWATHASIDWLWQLPAITFIAIALAGGLLACASPGQLRIRGRVGAPFAAAGIMLAIALVLPPTMADSSLRKAREPNLQKNNPKEAIKQAQRAQSFTPGWAEPYIVEGVLWLQEGKLTKASQAGLNAIKAEPNSWSVQDRAARLLAAGGEKQAATQANKKARALNPQLKNS